MKIILITGVASNVRGTLVYSLSKDMNNKIIILDNLSTCSFDKIPKFSNVEFIKVM